MKQTFRPIVICLTLLALIFGAPGPVVAASAADPLQAQKTSPEDLLNADGTLNLKDAFHGSLDLAGWDVQIDPQRGPIFAPASQPAPGQWASLGVGANGSLNSQVLAVAVNGTDVYLGGFFTNVTNLAADYVVKWDGTNWSALGSNGAGNGSLPDRVYALAVSGTNVYVGGAFANVNNNGVILAAADYIAKWDGTNWSALGSNGAGNGSLEDAGAVRAIAVSGTNVYVGGEFWNVNNNGTVLNAADFIAKWDGANWSALGSNGAGNASLNHYVYSIAVSGANVYAGGKFTDVNNNGTVLSAADYIAKWNGTNWSALGSNGAGDGSLNERVNAIAVSGTNIYVGGLFTNVNNNGTALNRADYITKWNGTSWSALGSNGAGDGSLNERVNAIAISGTNVYVGGKFTQVNNNGTVLQIADTIAKWDGTRWFALGSNGAGNGSITGSVNAIAVSGANVYVGGDFSDITNKDGTSVIAADFIAKWSGNTWSALGSVVVDGSINSNIYAIAIIGTDVYVGGKFKDVNNQGVTVPAADYIAKWDSLTGTWSALGSNGAGDGSLNKFVYTFAVSGTNLYVGGEFTDVNNNGTVLLAADYIAKWDTQTNSWSALGSNGAGDGSLGKYSSVNAIAISGANVYVGGDFDDVNNNGTVLSAADNIVKWNGSSWSALGFNSIGNGSIQGSVGAIAISGKDVYVGGYFENVNNNGATLITADYIAKWNGSSWSALGSNGTGNGSLNRGVNTIAISGTNIYVGGEFTDVKNNGTVLTAADYIAKWDTLTNSWSALGSNGAGNGSVNLPVYAIVVHGTNIYVGGIFTNVNSNGTVLPAADKIAKWNTLTSSWSALSSNGAGDGSIKPVVNAIKVSGTSLYVGGAFANLNNNGTVLYAADYIAAYGLGAASTATPTRTVTVTPTVTATLFLTATMTVTPTPTQTIGASPTETMTPTETATPTETMTPTETVTPTPTEP